MDCAAKRKQTEHGVWATDANAVFGVARQRNT